MSVRMLCPTLVGREGELRALEEALLGASRGEGRMVLVAGEAGLGKTRLSATLVERARKLGFGVMSGACSEAELSLPYLPFVQAVGNWLASQDLRDVAAALGPAAADLGQIFPQLGSTGPLGGDPSQAKLRLFEAFAALLALAARRRGLLVLIEDIHWADGSTRELLDHLARRAAGLRMLVVATYRSDELDRRHPLTATLQSWRRSGLAEVVRLRPLDTDGVALMVAAIFDSDEVSEEYRDLLFDRTEGNPFVLEEMLKDAIDRGDVYRTADGWERKPIQELRIPDTVRDAILLRVERLDPGDVAVLQAAAVLGRSFDYPSLVAVSGSAEASVQGALDAAIAQQLVEEDPSGAGVAAFQWRHALTQEAISTAIVLPRRQELHSRAADVLAGDPGAQRVDVARHLLGAGRFAEAVPVCLLAAEEAERRVAYAEAVALYEHAMPHVGDPTLRARMAALIGRDLWLDAAAGPAEPWLARGVDELEALGERLEAARFRLVLGRTRWERSRPDLALADFEAARAVLEEEGPSADLAMAYMRIAGLHTFELREDHAEKAARRAVEIATQVGADYERNWSEAFLALAIGGMGRLEEAVDMLARVQGESRSKGYVHIAVNALYNEVWLRVHFMLGPLVERAEEFELLPQVPVVIASSLAARSYALLATGDLAGALPAGREGQAFVERTQLQKYAWRGSVQVAEALVEMGELDDAARVLPDPSARAELQDFVYEGPARIHLLLAQGKVEEAARAAEEIAAESSRLWLYRETLAMAVVAFLAAGRVGDARAMVETGRRADGLAGQGYQELSEARVALADGDAERAATHARAAVAAARQAGFLLWELRARIVLAEALVAAGAAEEARSELSSVVARAGEIQAALVRSDALRAAGRSGIDLGAVALEAALEREVAEPTAVGERMVTTMFADVRGYTEMAASISPEELTRRMIELYGWAKEEVERHGGVVDKFAGDAVMATFNVAGDRVDHVLGAVQAALSLRDKAALLDLGVGIGLAVGPAVVGRLVPGANLSVLGTTTNLAARMQSAADGGEILLSDHAFRRVQAWLSDRGMEARAERLTLKGFDEPQLIHRVAAPVPVAP